MNAEDPTPPVTPQTAPPPPPVAEDRLVKIADLLGECRPPDILGGYDQCAHGTWPCVITQAAWLAQGRDRQQEVRAACQAADREAAAQDASWEAYQELRAAEREGRLPFWEAQTGREAG